MKIKNPVVIPIVTALAALFLRRSIIDQLVQETKKQLKEETEREVKQQLEVQVLSAIDLPKCIAN